MKLKKILALVLCTTAMASMALAGCGSSDEGSDANADTSAAADKTASSDDFSGKITVLSREDGSGTRGAFIELFGIEVKNEDGEKEDMTTVDATITNNTEVMMSTVAGNEYAIGYCSLGSLDGSSDSDIKAVKIDGAEATAENVANESYEVSRPFNIITQDSVSDVAQDFIDFILSADGQAIVTEEGYISVADGETFTSSGASGKITINGSSSVGPVMEKLVEAYKEVNPNATVEQQTTDSTTGVTAAIEGTCDIGMASRDLKEEETGVTATKIALDGIAVIVNTANPIEDISSDMVNQIFTGEVTEWSDVQ